MAQRSKRCFTAAALGLLLVAAPLSAMKIGPITVRRTAQGQVVQVRSYGLTRPRVAMYDGKLVIVVPGGERSTKTLELNAGPVKRIRFGQDGNGLHIVLDLKEKMRDRVLRVDARGFEIALLPEGGAPPAKADGGAASASLPGAGAASASESVGLGALNPAQVGYTYRVVDLSLGGDARNDELIVSADGPANYTSSVHEKGRLLRLDFLNSTLAWSGDASALKDASVAGVTVRQINVGGGPRVRVEVRLTGRLDYAFERDQNQLVVRLARPAAAPALAGKGDMSAPVTLDVQEADLVGVLKTLCEQAGFDYQFTRTLLTMTPPESLVTMKADHRPFHEVVDTLLDQVNAKEIRLGNTIYMGSASEIDRRRDSLPVVTRPYSPQYITSKQALSYLDDYYAYDDDEKARLKNITNDPRDPSNLLLVGTATEVADWIAVLKHVDVPDSGDGGGGGGNQPVTKVFHLDYLDSSNSSLIDGAIDQLYPDGETLPTPLIDNSTRTLVVTTPPKYLRKIEALLRKIDVRPWQVNIEGKIVEVDQSVASQLGVNWTLNSTSPNPGFKTGALESTLTPLFTGQLTYGTVLDAAAIQAEIQAMIQTNKADLISAPNITTIDNQPATISVTQVQVYVQTTTTISNGVVTNANTFPTSSVPLTLVVTPKISRPDHRILMNINFQLTTTTGVPPASGAPYPTNQESAITNVTVNSGETFVIGGLVKQDNTEEVQKVPILGDIPLLGLLFRFTQISKAKTDVVIFIKPTIVGS